MNLITPTELSRQMDISKQAVFKAIEEGLIPFTLSGKKKLIDLDNKSVQGYIRDNNRQREHAKKNDIQTVEDLKKVIVSEDRDIIDKVIKKIPGIEKGLIDAANKIVSEKRERKPIDNNNTSEQTELDMHEMTRRSKFAEMRKKELQVLVMEKKYLPTEIVEDIYFTYLEKFNSAVERYASTYIKDTGKKILESGEVLPEHIESFTQKILETIHNNKKAVHKEKVKYEPHL